MADAPRQVRWSEVAVRDLEELIAYAALESPERATRLLSALETKASSLRTTPDRGRIVPALATFGLRTWRELVVKPYRIVYRSDGRIVHVLAVLDGRRELHEVLLERLVRT